MTLETVTEQSITELTSSHVNDAVLNDTIMVKSNEEHEINSQTEEASEETAPARPKLAPLFAQPDDVSRGTQSVGPQVVMPDFVAAGVASSVADHLGFDPAIHAVNPDGTPRLTVDGAFAKKRGKGGQRRDVPRETSAAPGPTEADSAPGIGAGIPGVSATSAAAAAMTNAQTAVFLVRTITGVLGRAIGPEWLPTEKAEEKGLTDATKNYLDAVGGLQITPEMGLCLAIVAYSVPRFAVPNTQTKLQAFGAWVRDRTDVVVARVRRMRAGK